MNTQREQYLLLKELDEVSPHLKECRAILAGGAITCLFTGERVRDWDLYFRNAEDVAKAIELFSANGKETFTTDTARTFKWGQRRKAFQLIVMPELFGAPVEIFSHYDFTVCMGAYDFGVGEFVFHGDFVKHIAQRRLVFHTGTMFPICSLLRVLKYQRRGFSISGVELMKVALSIQRLDLSTYKDLRRQLMGIDTAFLKDLTDRFKEGEEAEKVYDFETFMQLIDDYMQRLDLTQNAEEEELS